MKAFIFWASIQVILFSFLSVSIAAPVSVFDGQGQHKGINTAIERDVNRPIPAYLVAGAWDQSAVSASRPKNRDDKANIDLDSRSALAVDEVSMSTVPISGAVSLVITVLLAAGVVARKKLRSRRREAVSA